MKPKNSDAAVLAGRGVGNHKALGAQEQITTLARLYGRREAGPETLSPALLLEDAAATLAWPQTGPVRLFVGQRAVVSSNEWRRLHGPGTAMALTRGVDPAGVNWPPLPLVAVIWTGYGRMPRGLVSRLARALKRAGVGFASLPHRVDQPNAWLAAASPEASP